MNNMMTTEQFEDEKDKKKNETPDTVEAEVVSAVDDFIETPLPPVDELTEAEWEQLSRDAYSQYDTIELPQKKQEINWYPIFGWIPSAVVLLLVFVSLCISSFSPPVTIFLMAKSLSYTSRVSLHVPLRNLGTLKTQQSVTVPSSGIVHQPSQTAAGTITAYNGSFVTQFITAGTVFTGSDGVKVITDVSTTVPANTPPRDGIATIPAHAMLSGSSGNISFGDINETLSQVLYVKNLGAFAGGVDAQTYHVVTQADIHTAQIQVKSKAEQAFQKLLVLRPDEDISLTQCVTTVSGNHALNDTTSSVTMTEQKSCVGSAYVHATLQEQAYTAFQVPHTYVLATSTATVITVNPFIALVHNTYKYVLTNEMKQKLSKILAGKSLADAKHILLTFGFDSYISASSLPYDANKLLFTLSS